MWDEERDRDGFPWASVIRSEMETWQPPPRRLEVCHGPKAASGTRGLKLAAVFVGGLALVLDVVVATGGVDLKQWWATALTVAHQRAQPAGQGGQGRLAGPPPGARVGTGHGPPAVAGAGGGPASTPPGSGDESDATGSPAGPGAGAGGSQGVTVTGSPLGTGGLTGTIGEGASVGGTLGGGGMQGCVAVHSYGGTVTTVCGSIDFSTGDPIRYRPGGRR